MILMITKIHPEKISDKLEGATIRKVDFVDYRFPDKKYHTFLISSFRNFKHWKGLRVGDVIAELELKNAERGEIDADSIPVFVAHKDIKQQEELFK